MGQTVKRFMGNIKPGFYKKSNDSLDSVDGRQCPRDLNSHPGSAPHQQCQVGQATHPLSCHLCLPHSKCPGGFFFLIL